MGNLPPDRLKPIRAFQICGVDFAGPFEIKSSSLRNAKIIKCYVALFVCFASKAVHLELVNDLTANSFLNTLKRFVSRRGKPSCIYSDNALNFVGAFNELKKLAKDINIVHYLGQEMIEWKFIPPRSPHFGGLWEASIKNMKTYLKKAITNNTLTYEQFLTVLAQVEACLNCRPLTPMSMDPKDLSVLTPAHFLIGDIITAVPQRNVLDVPTNRLDHYQRVQRIVQEFWSRWKVEYLHQLQNSLQGSKRSDLAVGDLVLIQDENTPPLKWSMGRIVELHYGNDGVARVATLKTTTGELKRAIRKLAKLPVNC